MFYLNNVNIKRCEREKMKKANSRLHHFSSGISYNVHTFVCIDIYLFSRNLLASNNNDKRKSQ